MKQPPSPREAYDKMAALCALSEQCRYDIRLKLLRRGLAPEEADAVVERLERERFIDDARYARAFARDKWRFQGWGRVKVKRALQLKQISSAAIDAALQEIQPDGEYEQLVRALRHKRAHTTATGAKLSAQLFRFAASRGYESSLIFKAMKEIGNRADDDYDDDRMA